MQARRMGALAVAAALYAGQAVAETETEYAAPRSPHGAAAAAGTVEAPPARRASLPSFFASGSAKTAVRLPPEVREERAFIRAAAANSRFALEASKLALSKSASPRVRELAADVVQQQKETQLELAHLLHARDMAMPMLENEHVRVLKRLGKLGGARFDHAYLDQVGLKAGREAIGQYEKASASLKDASLKAWADQKLPGLRVGLVAAERLAPGGVNTRTAQGGRASRPSSVTPVAAKLSESNTR